MLYDITCVFAESALIPYRDHQQSRAKERFRLLAVAVVANALIQQHDHDLGSRMMVTPATLQTRYHWPCHFNFKLLAYVALFSQVCTGFDGLISCV